MFLKGGDSSHVVFFRVSFYVFFEGLMELFKSYDRQGVCEGRSEVQTHVIE